MSRFTICEAEQRSPEWFAARAGRATGSNADCVMAQGKKANEEAVTRRDYRVRLAVERITGKSQEDDYLSADMRRGIELEPEAILSYEAFTGNLVRRTGFLVMTDYPVGCSLDWDVSEFEGFGELKCPKAAIHIEYIKARRVPPVYVKQITHNFWVTGAKWVDFVSYNNEVPEHLQTFVVRAYRSEFDIASYEPALQRFLAEVNLTVKEIQALKVAA
jgi:predicted phage-related endonuclease